MILPSWKGWASPEKGQSYLEHLRGQVFTEMEGLAGFRGAYVTRSESGGESEFQVLTFWDSLEAIRGFAGDDLEMAVVPPEARALLSRFDDRVGHCEVVVAIDGRSG